MLPFLIAAYLGRSELLVCAVVREAERQGLDPVVVCALVEIESSWRIHARSETGDFGLMQINAAYHGKYLSTSEHIRQGVRILRKASDRYGGRIVQALSCYNTGRFTARGARYADKVLRVAARIKEAVSEKRTSIPIIPATVTRKDRLYGFAFEWAPRRRVDKGKG